MTKDEAIKILEESKNNSITRTLREWEEWDVGFFEAIDMAIDLLSLDIIHCKNCKRVGTKQCPFYAMGLGYTDEDFCSYGKRKKIANKQSR